ncbi:MAG: hypothetical protein ACI9IP_000657 [Arcticibacterium sp.]|jgi:uncharacterized protein YecE (DUF72 family)
MKFGSVTDASFIDFTLPPDPLGTAGILKKGKHPLMTYVGCAKWNRGDLKGFYPRGTKDELAYYATQFNSIELNATFYNNYSDEQIQKWCDKTPTDFRFFPKVSNYVSHIKRLNDVKGPMAEVIAGARSFGERLGMSFLQVHDNFKPSNMQRLIDFVSGWSADVPLAVELRNTEWFQDEAVAKEVYEVFEEFNVTNIITDTAGRRDLLHMRLTTPVAFIRYVGANHPTDYPRLDDWLDRIESWREAGLEKLYFFVHQNMEKESPLLSKYFIEKYNDRFNGNLRGPEGENSLFS